MGLERASNLLFAAYHRAKEENKAKTRIFFEESSEVEYSYSKKDSDIDDLSSKYEDYGEDKNEADGCSLAGGVLASWIDIGNTPQLKEKLIRILAGDVTITK